MVTMYLVNLSLKLFLPLVSFTSCGMSFHSKLALYKKDRLHIFKEYLGNINLTFNLCLDSIILLDILNIFFRYGEMFIPKRNLLVDKITFIL